MEDAFEHVVYSKGVIEFVAVANEYCSYLEQSKDIPKKDFLLTMQKLLPLLYIKASLIPPVDTELEELPEKFVTEDDYNHMNAIIKEKLGYIDSYHEVFDPLMQESEGPVSASLSENMSDMYQDLKDFLLLYRIGTTEIMNDALWECKDSFERYWGQKLVNGLRAIHAVLYGDYDLNKDEDEKSKEDKIPDDPDTGNWIITKRMKDYKNDNE